MIGKHIRQARQRRGSEPSGIPVTTAIDIAVPREQSFAAIVPIDLTRIFTGMGPLPAVVAVHDQTAPWNRAGARRRVELADGSTAREQLTACDAPGHFAYRLDQFSGPFGALVSHAEGSWWFSPHPPGTHVSWTYVFHPRPGRTALVRWLIVPLWRRYQQRAMALAAGAVEDD